MLTNKKITFITDSTCDIPQILVEEHQITIAPCYVLWGEKTYRDREDITSHEFYQRLQSDPIHPTTSCPSPQDFLQVFQAARADGAEAIITVTLSSAMSNTHESACQAAAEMDIPVHVVDAKGPSMTIGWQILAGARAYQAGADVQSVLQTINNTRNKMVLLVSMNTIEYLHRGGRIGSAARFIGNVLDMKPVIQINHQTGLVEGLKRVRTYRKAVNVMYDEFFEQLGDATRARIAVLHGNNPGAAQKLVERIQADFSPLEIVTNITGPVLGINTGPGALALCGYTDTF